MQPLINRRILAQTGIPRLFSVLAQELIPSDLQSLLLSVYRERVQGRRAPQVLEHAGRSTLFAPSSVDARVLNLFDRIAFETAAGFEAVELSPVCPLGTEFTLGGIDQNNILTTIRNAEVLGDSPATMALECARRRRNTGERSSAAAVKLCSSQRVVRLQPFEVPGFTPHFRLFALVTAGRSKDVRIQDHIRFYLELFRALNAHGFAFRDPLVEISDLTKTEDALAAAGITRDEVRRAVRAHKPGSGEQFLTERGIRLPEGLENPLLKDLRQEFAEAEIRFKLDRLEGLGYYAGFCLRISARAPDGERYPLADGGFTDWTARLLEDRKERLLTSGIGSEFVCKVFR